MVRSSMSMSMMGRLVPQLHTRPGDMTDLQIHLGSVVVLIILACQSRPLRKLIVTAAMDQHTVPFVRSTCCVWRLAPDVRGARAAGHGRDVLAPSEFAGRTLQIAQGAAKDSVCLSKTQDMIVSRWIEAERASGQGCILWTQVVH